LFRAIGIRSGPGPALWFVRPALRPYCHALYGAHSFRYFLFEERAAATGWQNRLVFRSGGDRFAAYPTRHHGLNDIETTGAPRPGATACEWPSMADTIGRSGAPAQFSRMAPKSGAGFDAEQGLGEPRHCS
jgi:hypothetical protein